MGGEAALFEIFMGKQEAGVIPGEEDGRNGQDVREIKRREKSPWLDRCTVRTNVKLWVENLKKYF